MLVDVGAVHQFADPKGNLSQMINLTRMSNT